MAQTWEAKTAAETKRYRWKPPVPEFDGLTTYSSSASGATIESEDRDDDELVYYVSGGVNGTTAIISLSALTTRGETLTETIYLPIAVDTAAGTTAEDIVGFALKPVVGLSGTPTTAEKDDGLEHLNDMLAEWRLSGGEVGAALPLTLATPLYAPPGWMSGIKNNLRVRVAEQYGRQVAPATVIAANRGLQAIKFSRLDHTEAEYY
jgi:hypothetical protein